MYSTWAIVCVYVRENAVLGSCWIVIATSADGGLTDHMDLLFQDHATYHQVLLCYINHIYVYVFLCFVFVIYYDWY